MHWMCLEWREGVLTLWHILWPAFDHSVSLLNKWVCQQWHVIPWLGWHLQACPSVHHAYMQTSMYYGRREIMFYQSDNFRDCGQHCIEPRNIELQCVSSKDLSCDNDSHASLQVFDMLCAAGISQHDPAFAALFRVGHVSPQVMEQLARVIQLNPDRSFLSALGRYGCKKPNHSCTAEEWETSLRVSNDQEYIWHER